MIKQQVIEKCGTLSMGDVESIERTLGRLLTITEFQNKELSEIRGGVSIIKNSVEASDKKAVEFEMMIKDNHERTDELEDRIKKSEATLEEHETLKNKGMGIMAFIGVIMGFLGWLISSVIMPHLMGKQ